MSSSSGRLFAGGPAHPLEEMRAQMLPTPVASTTYLPGVRGQEVKVLASAKLIIILGMLGRFSFPFIVFTFKWRMCLHDSNFRLRNS